MSDPLAVFWQHAVTVERLLGEGAAGPVYDEARVEPCNVATRQQIVRDASGDEVVASASVVLPASVGAIPPGSRITLPEGRLTRVITAAYSDMRLPFPQTVAVTVE